MDSGGPVDAVSFVTGGHHDDEEEADGGAPTGGQGKVSRSFYSPFGPSSSFFVGVVVVVFVVSLVKVEVVHRVGGGGGCWSAATAAAAGSLVHFKYSDTSPRCLRNVPMNCSDPIPKCGTAVLDLH